MSVESDFRRWSFLPAQAVPSGCGRRCRLFRLRPVGVRWLRFATLMSDRVGFFVRQAGGNDFALSVDVSAMHAP